LGRIDLLRGDLAGAVRHLRRASATPAPFDLPFHPYNVSFLARALAGCGHPSEARTAVAEVDPSLPRFRLFESEAELAEAAILAAEGNLAGAVERAAWAAELAAVRDLWTVAMIGAHDAARYGGATIVQRVAADSADHVEGDLPAARAELIAAQAASSGPDLDRVAAAFESIGALLFAAETAAQAARCHQRAGRTGAAATSEAAYRRLLTRCPGVVCPWLAGVTARDPLTRREQEVAILAAADRRDAEVADELGISIRTVQTHLSRVYMKLDIHSRSELAEALLVDRGSGT
jgi:DNA-binding CsgD family transcriptional regulator